MNARKLKFPVLVLLNILLFTLVSSALGYSKEFLNSDEFEALEPDAQKAIKLVIKHKEVKDFLNTLDYWSATTYADDETKWHIDFSDANDWIGYAHVDLSNKEIYDLKLIRDLSPKDYQAGKERIEKLVLKDAEVLAVLGDTESWSYDINYNKWDQAWEMYFWRGIEQVAISFWEDDKNFSIDDIYDPQAFSDEEQAEHDRNQAIEIAYQADGIDDALEGVYDWHTYAEPHGDSVWGVEFTAGGKLFYAVVDIASGEIIEARGQ